MSSFKIHNIFKLVIYLLLFLTVNLFIFYDLALKGSIDFLNIPVVTSVVRWKFYLFLSFLLSLILLFIFLIIKNCRMDENRIINKLFNVKTFVVFMFICGSVISVLMPIFQIPDELHHLDLMYSSIGWNASVIDISDYYSYLNNFMRGNCYCKVNPELYFNLDINGICTFSDLCIDMSIIKYFPQVIIFLICSIFNAPSFVAFTCTEIFALLFYCLCCYFALSWMPKKKCVLAMIMFLPISLQQAASFSYDVLLISLIFLFISKVFQLAYSKKKIKVYDILFIFLMISLITYIKIPYFLLIFLILLIPINNKHSIIRKSVIKIFSKKLSTIIILITAFIIIVASLFLLYLLKNNIYVKIIYVFITNFFRALFLLWNTFLNNLLFYLESSTCFLGSLDSRAYIFSSILIFTIVIIVSIMCSKNNCKNRFNAKSKIILIVLSILLLILIMVSMYEWTCMSYLKSKGNLYNDLSIDTLTEIMYSTDIIQGVQGRYLIPVFLLFMLCFDGKQNKNNVKFNYKFLTIIYCVFVALFVFYILYARYWS